MIVAPRTAIVGFMNRLLIFAIKGEKAAFGAYAALAVIGAGLRVGTALRGPEIAAVIAENFSIAFAKRGFKLGSVFANPRQHSFASRARCFSRERTQGKR